VRELVAGDVVALSAGDMIPADCRVLSARDLFVAQASLTGESLPVEKVASSRDPQQGNPLECDTLCFMGTNVVSGTARVTRGEETFLVSENQSTYIPLGVKHRLENPGIVPLEMIEVQSGSYLGEDDIVRFEDTYGRT
jgi:hypothetical protein